MILIALALLLFLTFFYKAKLLPYTIMVYFVLFDMFDGFYEEEKVYSVIRYVVPLTLLAIYMLKYRVGKRIDFIFYVLAGYLILLWLTNSGDFLISSRSLM